MKIYEEVVIDMNPESSTYGEHLSEESYDYEGDIALAGGSIGDLFHRPGGYSWHKSKEWEDPSTGVTYETKGRKKKGGMFGFGKRHSTGEAEIKGRGLEGESVLGTTRVDTSSALGQKMIDQAKAAGHYTELGGGQASPDTSAMGTISGSMSPFSQAFQNRKYAPDEWLEGLKKTASDRWKPVGAGMKFDLSDPDSIKEWIKNISPGGSEMEGFETAENWFQQQAQGLKQGMQGVNINELVEEKGDIMKIAGASEGTEKGKFLDIARGLGESLGQYGAFDPSKHGGQFLKYVTSGTGPMKLLDEMKGRLATYEEEESEEREQFQTEGARRGEQTRGRIEELQKGPYTTGRQQSQIEGLLEDLRTEQAQAREAYEKTSSGLWGTHVGGELEGLAQEWTGIETSSEGH